jgi:hypothetical protein
VQTLVNDFRTSERALGVLLTYRTRRISRSGAAVSPGFPDDGALARIVRRPNGAIEYVMRTALGDAALTLQFGHQEVAVLFQDPSGLPLSGEVFLIRTKLCVPGGMFLQVSAGDTCSPACVYFAGICPPSGNAVVVSVIAGRGGCPPPAGCRPRPPGVCARTAIGSMPRSAIIANPY